MDILFYIISGVGILLNFSTIMLMKRVQKRSLGKRQVPGDIVDWETKTDTEGREYYIPTLTYLSDSGQLTQKSREGYSRKPAREKSIMLLVSQDDPEDVRLFHCEKQVRLAFIVGLLGIALTVGGIIALWVTQ